MNLGTFILKRLALIIPTLIGVTLITFTISRVVPGDPARLAAGAQGTQEMYQQLRQEFGLDDPLPTQYFHYISGLVQGDWGTSILSRRPVLDDLRVYWPATLELVIVAMFFATITGVPLGVIAAIRADKLADHVSRIVALLGVSVPAFWLAILAQLFFGLKLGWLPVSGRLGPLMDAPTHTTGLYLVDSAIHGQWDLFYESLKRLLLPAIVLSVPAMATIMRFTRASMLEVLNQDYIRTARAKGATERRVIVRHALRNALVPTLTMIGLSFGWAMGGSVLVETVFDWPGIGLYATKSALSLDFMPIMGIALLYGFVFALINIAVDVLYALLDPRISRA
jgi:peptide/nickel transport system permease protein